MLVHVEREDGPKVRRRRRILYGVTTAVLAGLLLVAVSDVFTDSLGVDSATVTVRAVDGSTLTVEHPSTTRPALASPFSVEVVRPGGFDGPIEIAVSRPWIEVWDENGFYPTPSGETGDADWVVWEFDPPDGDRFRFFYDARLEPARQWGIDGAVELRDGAATLARVDFRTNVRP